MEKIRTVVNIAGKDYTLSGYDSEDYVKRVAGYVDRKLNEMTMATRLPLQQVAIFTAVNFADEMIKAQDEIKRLRKEIDLLRVANDQKK